MTRNLTYLFFLLLIVSCKKDSTEPTPSIEFVSVSSTSVSEGDPLTFRISYTDGDGDLGENEANAYNLFLIDNRINLTYQYRIRELAPSNATISIRGNLDVVLNSATITDGSSSQGATFSIYVKDRAGNQSNSVSSPSITIHN